MCSAPPAAQRPLRQARAQAQVALETPILRPVFFHTRFRFAHRVPLDNFQINHLKSSAMTLKPYLWPLFSAGFLSVGLVACTSQSASAPEKSDAPQQAYDLDFSKQPYTLETAQINGQTLSYRAYEGIIYVRHPVEPQYQRLNIYIPEAYFQNQSVEGWTAQTAPIFLPNQIGGYMPARPGKPGAAHFGPPDPSGKPKADALQIALAKGYIVASPGARGRTSPTGKAPAAIVDLKAAVRYLHLNDAIMPGDATKIISNGTSAGGALSVLLGASGNSTDYAAELQALGAAQAPDDIFAVSAYCPISLLDHADAAYEWQFQGVNDYQKMDIRMLDYKVERKLISGTLTPEQIQLSRALKPLFPPYLNSLNLTNAKGQALTLDQHGNGPFKKYVESYLIRSAQSALDAGQNLSNRAWLKLKNGKVISADFAGYARAAGRQKLPPAFDAVDLSSGENQLFGATAVDKQHFTTFSQQHNTAPGATLADPHTVEQMNPLLALRQAPSAAHHWRIRVGTADRDTSLAIATILATKLENTGYAVDFAMPWDVPHSGDYDLDALFAWIKRTTQP